MNDDWLSNFGKALETQAQHREEQRKKLNEKRGEPALFIPSDDQEGGVGYWFWQGYVIGIQKYSNGYSIQPCFQMEVSLLQKLAELSKEEGK